VVTKILLLVLVAGYYGMLRRGDKRYPNSFVTVDSYGVGSDNGWSVAVSPLNGAVYAVFNTSGQTTLRRSATGLSGTFTTVDTMASSNSSYGAVGVSPVDGAVYFGSQIGLYNTVRKSTTGLSGTFTTIDTLNGGGGNGSNITGFAFSGAAVFTCRL
jgi:hypothetical protein